MPATPPQGNVTTGDHFDGATSGRRGPQLLVDTSVAVALTVSDHRDHVVTFEAVADRRLGLSGHAAFEAFSVLTRLPAPTRRTPAP